MARAAAEDESGPSAVFRPRPGGRQRCPGCWTSTNAGNCPLRMYVWSGTLAAPRHATALDKPVGQWLTNLRRPDGLGKDPERAARRAQQLAAMDPDWNPGQLGWTVDWQRHYTGLRVLLAAGGTLDEILPGVT
ncbi:hypothetical protein [Streptomyces sp. NPDC005078]|uniref:hypothetical protein n=1 Tax=unclassified Streptomyces TaxID=2593676 RepID=UPI0033A537C9